MGASKTILVAAGFPVVAFILSQAVPVAAQTRTTGATPSPTFTAPPIRNPISYENVPVSEPYNLPPVLLTPLNPSFEYSPVFGRQAGGSGQDVVRPEARVQERTEDRIQPQPRIGSR